ncbi:GlxA family transcriptional regulator [Pseudogemmobacter faecipullorum]|uniref:GlxA family transcriptional regulator n=1 Tax=Pseudogemmobacter faecipullorum TaxID=2755041 RepID=A0ABS8CGK8_9RHOB|nr:GlxA family transcriptional regulator [Pseudogemmobacter faecipullorum]MCB5408522.1 GlxA family transcriptional regulator [Pseudogemmobacter faecipullorum]
MHQNENALHLGFLIFPGFPMACLTSAIEPLRAANEITGKRAFRWSVVGEAGSRVVSSAEVGFDPDLTLAGLEAPDHLYLLSGPGGKFANARSSNAALRRLVRHGTSIGAFSGGIFPLARAGLLDNHKASVHWCYEAAFKSEFPEVIPSEKVITIDRDRLTAAGATAVFDLMLRLIEDHLGAEAMIEVACWFQHPFVRGEEVEQRIPAQRLDRTEDMLPEPVARAIRLFAEHIEEPIQIAEVAEAVDLSSRQFDRSFKRSTGQSPLKYYRLLRLKKARQMTLYSNDTITEIALAVGYASTTPLVRHYQQAFGVTPQEDRKQANRFRVKENAPLPAA